MNKWTIFHLVDILFSKIVELLFNTNWVRISNQVCISHIMKLSITMNFVIIINRCHYYGAIEFYSYNHRN